MSSAITNVYVFSLNALMSNFRLFSINVYSEQTANV